MRRGAVISAYFSDCATLCSIIRSLSLTHTLNTQSNSHILLALDHHDACAAAVSLAL
jgi:hypothetical protein